MIKNIATPINMITTEQREQSIINNLYEFWHYVGIKSGKLITKESFESIMLSDSDWPKKIFKLKAGAETLINEIAGDIKLQKLPNAIVFTETAAQDFTERLTEEGFYPSIKQQGMIIKLSDFQRTDGEGNCKFSLVKNKNEADRFATIASQSFKYKVDGAILLSFVESKNVKLFIGWYENVPAFCGLIFYDESNLAGLHMIGTLPQFRGKGLATIMTNKLLEECIKDGKGYCVLHASAAGEPIYSRLGFERVKEIITYSLKMSS